MFTIEEAIDYTRRTCAMMGHPVDDWTDDEVLTLANAWGMRVTVILLDVAGRPLESTRH